MVILPVEKRIDWKRPPIVLLAIVALNILVFAFYQIHDNEKFFKAANVYTEHNLLNIELDAYKAFLKSNNEEFHTDLDNDSLTLIILSDNQFESFLDANYQQYIAEEDQSDWLKNRTSVNEHLKSISIRQLGVDSHKPNLLTLITHQFLHGGIFHLIGNLVFLILAGFAVEAALGGRRFLTYYLLSGIGASLFDSIIQILSSDMSTISIGASGSVSGVMAMYVSLFRLKKIQFFYWFLIFTGYFRAIALIMVPIYIANELVVWLLSENSNIGFFAHIGGFITGAALILATQHFDNKAIDSNYLEENEKLKDPYLIELQSLYRDIANCNFKKAWSALQQLKSHYPKKNELVDIEYNLLLALNKKKARSFLESKIGKTDNTQHIVEAQARLWSLLKDNEKDSFDTDSKLALASDFLSYEIVSGAEQIYKSLASEKVNQQQMASLARRLSMYFQQQDNFEKSDRYNQQAVALMKN